MRLPELIQRRHALGPLEIFTLLLASFTFLLAVATNIQGWAFIQSERASVAVGSIRIDPTPLAAGPVNLDLRLQNAGRETAVIEGTVVQFRIDDVLPPNPSYGKEQEWQSIILPNGIKSIGTYLTLADGSRLMLNEQQVALINSQQLYFWIYGRIRYSDKFSLLFGRQEMGFCSVYMPRNKPDIGMFNDCEEVGYTYAR